MGPVYEAALLGVTSLTKEALDEVRTYREPPDGVKICMKTVCMLLGREER
ncbi:unnamed protein product [Protopolystoma xenopodis]|uniref:Uncharacterized protein n=1 Tax=Protopolystoma xenopodis TaxID=117903 RepID=A0A3S5CJZ1_9PLAT|nr:unnamed protein product [Protopolystoma xenopodis]